MKLATAIHEILQGAQTIESGQTIELDDETFAELLSLGAVRVSSEDELQLYRMSMGATIEAESNLFTAAAEAAAAEAAAAKDAAAEAAAAEAAAAEAAAAEAAAAEAAAAEAAAAKDASLEERAELVGIKLDGRWSEERKLAAIIEAERAAASPDPEVTEL